jgi:hypothetical protein
MIKPCPRPGCPGVVMQAQTSLGFTYCTAVCSQIEAMRSKVLARLESAELGGRPTHVTTTLEEINALDTLEDAYDSWLSAHIRNIPRLRTAVQEVHG